MRVRQSEDLVNLRPTIWNIRTEEYDYFHLKQLLPPRAVLRASCGAERPANKSCIMMHDMANIYFNLSEETWQLLPWTVGSLGLLCHTAGEISKEFLESLLNQCQNYIHCLLII